MKCWNLLVILFKTVFDLTVINDDEYNFKCIIFAKNVCTFKLIIHIKYNLKVNLKNLIG